MYRTCFSGIFHNAHAQFEEDPVDERQSLERISQLQDNIDIDNDLQSRTDLPLRLETASGAVHSLKVWRRSRRNMITKTHIPCLQVRHAEHLLRSHVDSLTVPTLYHR